MKGPFLLASKELSELFEQHSTGSGKALGSLYRLHGVLGICAGLVTSASEGLDPSNPPLSLRESFFGNNHPQLYKEKSIFHFICANLSDTVLQILICAAAVSLGVGLWQDPSKGWLEGLAILIAVIVIVSVTAGNDYLKEKQFIKLNRETDTQKAVVMRAGNAQELPVNGLLVGDLIEVNAGDIVPADCLLVRGHSLLADESAITGESVLVRKNAPRAGDTDSDPFLVSGSKVVEGRGYGLVCNVGENSVQGKTRVMSNQVEEEGGTPLQERLEVIAEGLGKVGLVAGVLLTTVLLGHTAFDAMGTGRWGDNEWQECVTAVILGITILVVAIPEGLPLALTLSMAYSILRMKKEHIFVKHLQGCEIMGSATSICCDKTGTLTTNQMTVVKAFLCAKEASAQELRLHSQEQELLVEVVARNSTVFMAPDGAIVGNHTEAALMKLLQSWGFDYNSYRKLDLQVLQFAFNSSSKKMTTVYTAECGGYTVYCKGAPEIVLDSSKYWIESGSTKELTAEDRALIRLKLRSFNNETLRVLAVAYKVLGPGEVTEEDQAALEKDLIFLGFFGIKDPLRAESAQSVQKCQGAGLKVLMLTGDSIEISVKIAKECGILPEDLTQCELADYVLEGPVFRELVGGLVPKLDASGKVLSFTVGNLAAFSVLVPTLRVIARCSPADKLLLVTGLKELGEVVGVTGDGSNDAAALKQSDIGLAMMSGTPLAKESADIILMDDNFASVVNTLKWGRNVYLSIRKFLQFQVTVNIVALVVSIVGALTVENSPLNAVQMLWVNLIMDSMAALALATEPPTEALFRTVPFGRTEPIINTDMYVTMVSQTLYQIIILLGLLYGGPSVLGVESGWDNEDWTQENGLHFTLFFHTFVMLQIFNEINCRKLSIAEWNVFQGFFNNLMFVGILVFTVVVQMSFVQLGGEVLRCSHLSVEQHLLCIALGSGSLLVGLFTRMLAYGFFQEKTAKPQEELPLLSEEKRLIKNKS